MKKEKSVRFNTSRFGEIEILEDKVITFEDGIIGFKDKKKYIILPHRENNPLLWLQSIEDERIAFIMMSPLLFLPDYLNNIAADVDWDVKARESISVYGIIVVPKENKKNILMNLLAPLLINMETRKGKQIIISNSDFKVAEPIAPYIEKITKALTLLHSGTKEK